MRCHVWMLMGMGAWLSVALASRPTTYGTLSPRSPHPSARSPRRQPPVVRPLPSQVPEPPNDYLHPPTFTFTMWQSPELRRRRFIVGTVITLFLFYCFLRILSWLFAGNAATPDASLPK